MRREKEIKESTPTQGTQVQGVYADGSRCRVR